MPKKHFLILSTGHFEQVSQHIFASQFRKTHQASPHLTPSHTLATAHPLPKCPHNQPKNKTTLCSDPTMTQQPVVTQRPVCVAARVSTPESFRTWSIGCLSGVTFTRPTLKNPKSRASGSPKRLGGPCFRGMNRSRFECFEGMRRLE